MNHKRLLSVVWTGLVLLIGISGCGGTIKTAEYPATWPPRITQTPGTDCLNISGTYKISDDQPILPFLLFGIVDEDSSEWRNLVRIYEEKLLPDPNGAAITILYPDTEHIEVVLLIQGKSVVKQVLTRSYQSEETATWLGQHNQSFRCGTESIIINSSYIHSWDIYRLTDEEKRRRYRKLYGAVGPLGVSEGYFYFSKTSEGSLVMHAHPYGCYPCKNLDGYWLQWNPVYSQTTQ